MSRFAFIMCWAFLGALLEIFGVLERPCIWAAYGFLAGFIAAHIH
jgi:hypothetical protein